LTFILNLSPKCYSRPASFEVNSNMRKILCVLAVAAGLGMVIIVIGAIYVARTWDRQWDVPVPQIQASTKPAVIRRGEYLVFGPAHCAECHSASMQDYREGYKTGKHPPLQGGMIFSAEGLGAVYSKNLTPDPETGIGRYSDGQIARMLRWSVRPNGRASVRLLMPFDKMSDEDVVAIISFLRSQPPVHHVVPENEVTTLGKIVKSFAPVYTPREDVHPPAVAPAEAPTRERGEYLVRHVANCGSCHTKMNSVTFAPIRPEYSGGDTAGPADVSGADPNTWFITPNLTPAKDSALSKFPDRATFVARFQKGGRQYEGSPMPWESFGTMSEADLGAIYEFLHSLMPVDGPTGDPRFRKVNNTSDEN
jgi:mono/diheme cytochrome c family protein